MVSCESCLAASWALRAASFSFFRRLLSSFSFLRAATRAASSSLSAQRDLPLPDIVLFYSREKKFVLERLGTVVGGDGIIEFACWLLFSRRNVECPCKSRARKRGSSGRCNRIMQVRARPRTVVRAGRWLVTRVGYAEKIATSPVRVEDDVVLERSQVTMPAKTQGLPGGAAAKKKTWIRGLVRANVTSQGVVKSCLQVPVTLLEPPRRHSERLSGCLLPPTKRKEETDLKS